MLLEITSLPTAAGREEAVQRMLDLWVASLGGRVRLERDDAGNSLVTLARGSASRAAMDPSAERSSGARRAWRGARVDGRTDVPGLLITAHLDHPAFVLRRMISSSEAELEFRGGVHDPYFTGAALEIFDSEGASHIARIVALESNAQPFKRVRARLPSAIDRRLLPRGCIARWRLPPAEIRHGRLLTHACDDLAAVAAAMITFERLLRADGAEGVGLLFTVAEEVGFLGAIHACEGGLVPRGAILLCLENSRSFPHDSPIGAGAILRVGDRLSVFSPAVTNALTQLYQEHAAAHPGFTWQRKLMPGGACEATAFAALGHQSTCLCLPLGNYHNMRDIDGVLAGRRRPVVEREFVAIADVESLISMLLLASGAMRSGSLPRPSAADIGRSDRGRSTLGDFRPMLKRLWRERSRLVLNRDGHAT